MSIANNISRITNAKSDIKSAIIAKGVAVADTDKIDDYASKISSIDTELLARGLIERSITSIDIPDETTTIAANVFARFTTLQSVTFPQSVTEIGYSAFYACSGLTSLILPSNLIIIGDSAFNTCTNLYSVLLSDNLETIGTNTFLHCQLLPTITIPSSVTTIGADAFYDCPRLLNIIINKPQDSITGAPWGATNATVTWLGGE